MPIIRAGSVTARQVRRPPLPKVPLPHVPHAHRPPPLVARRCAATSRHGDATAGPLNPRSMGTGTWMGCVLVGHAHQRLSEGLRTWLRASFDGAFMVADTASLTEGTDKLQPELVVLDLGLAEGRLEPLLAELHQRSPHSRVLVLSDYDDPRLDALILSNGADGVVHKTALAHELSAAVAAVMSGQRFGDVGNAPAG